jgi:hypothetical protein
METNAACLPRRLGSEAHCPDIVNPGVVGGWMRSPLATAHDTFGPLQAS